ncbi:DUF6602 domain-containing protein [Xanthobacter flavus]|uniref:DUF6602 domain-containing protein n=1 Tax=Xanthobacter flavus TaxID=281 RepID=UPI0037287BBF
MPNDYVRQRLSGIRTILNGVHQGSSGLSSATSGQERAAFIDNFLANVLPPMYRFGSGDVTDKRGTKSGQIDVLVEYTVSPSLPIIGNAQTRLYLAEGCAAAIEIKSNIAVQWNQAKQTAEKLSHIHRQFGPMMIFSGVGPTPNIPLFVVGYTGWSTLETVKNNVDSDPNLTGALVIDSGLYYSKNGIVGTGDWALWGLICDLHTIARSLMAASPNILEYATEF